VLPFRFYAQKVAVEIEEMKILVDIAKILSKERSCMRIVISFVEYCQGKGYVTEEQAPWLQYVLAKRLSTLLIYIVLLILGIYIASPVSSFAFVTSFLYLRERTNGIHAKSIWGCVLGSIISEVVFLGVFLHLVTIGIAVLLLAVSSILVYCYAPYNHPSMHLTLEEELACATASKKRVLFLDTLAIFTYLGGYYEIGHCITLSTTMTACMLVIANITSRRNKNEGTR